MNEPKARLDKTRSWVLCVDVSCGARLTRIVRRPGRGEQLWFGPGWFFDAHGRAWILPRRAFERIVVGKPGRSRRPPMNRTDRWDDGRQTSGTLIAYRANRLPASIVCPSCGTPQVLDESELDIDITPMDFGGLDFPPIPRSGGLPWGIPVRYPRNRPPWSS